VRAWASFDDGATWRSIRLVDLGSGKRQAVLTNPKIGNNSAAVSLRVNAVDAAGNAIDQTSVRAYGLKPAG
jgi:hypothetical protein